jgi:hypothetical protein
MTAPRPRSARGVILAGAGTLVVIAYAAFAALQILVLNPLAAVPGKTLGRIVDETDAAGQPLGQAYTIAVLSVGVLLAVVMCVLSATRWSRQPRVIAAVYLGLLAAGAPGYFYASFGPGMSLADTYFITGGDHSPWGAVLYAVSGVSAVALVILAVTSGLRAVAASRLSTEA